MLTIVLVWPLSAVQAGIAASVHQVMPVSRNGAPIELDVTLRQDGEDLIEGNLELTVRYGDRVLLRQSTEPTALGPGERTSRIMLQPLPAVGLRLQPELTLRLLTLNGPVFLGRFPLSLPNPMQRSLVLGVVEAPARLDAPFVSAAQGLELSPFLPSSPRVLAPGPDGVAWMGLVTSFETVAPADLPTEPLNLCAYDVLVLLPTGFSALKAGQAEALLRWVRAGGSVCVVLGPRLASHHAAFVSALAGADSAPFGLDLDGNLVLPATVPTDKMSCFHVGLGRAVLAPTRVLSDLAPASAEWRRTIIFLWKVRQSMVAQVEKRQVRPDTALDILGPLPVDTILPLYRSLMPGAVAAVPPMLALLVILLFVLAIGPADYLLLGWVRCRHWTWLSFPVLCVGFTAAILILARHVRGREDLRRALVLIDVDARDVVLRTTRLELLLQAKDRDVTSEVRHAWFAVVEPPSAAESGARRVTPPGPELTGRVPVQCKAMLRLRQWQPQMVKTMGFATAPSGVPAPAWPADAAGVSPGQAPAGTGTGAASAPVRTAEVVVYVDDLCGMSRRALARREAAVRNPGWRLGNSEVAPLLRFFGEISAPPRDNGFFSIVSQISPNGAGHVEELAVHDPDVPGERLQLLLLRQGGDYIAYRRVVRRPPAGPQP